MNRTLAAATAVGLLAALPAAASAKTYKAYAGDPAKPPGSAPAGVELNKFFPAKLKVRQGDKVKYQSLGFHNVTVLAKGAQVPPLVLPDPQGGTYQGLKTPAGGDFFYDGLTKFIYNAAVFAPSGDGNVTKNETGDASGILLPSAKGPGTATVKFSAAGTTKIYCTIHPGMVQKVKVLKKKAKGADKPAKVQVKALKQAGKAYKDASKAAKQPVPAQTVYAGVERRNATVLAFVPGNATIPVGGTVTFKNMSPSEVHNELFIGAKGADGKGTAEAYADQHQSEADLLPFGPGANQLGPDYIYGSEPTATRNSYTYSGTNYGNGYLQTPLMDGDPGNDAAQGAPPSTETVTFTQAGTYHYYCAIHGKEMAGTITVQ